MTLKLNIDGPVQSVGSVAWITYEEIQPAPLTIAAIQAPEGEETVIIFDNQITNRVAHPDYIIDNGPDTVPSVMSQAEFEAHWRLP